MWLKFVCECLVNLEEMYDRVNREPVIGIENV